MTNLKLVLVSLLMTFSINVSNAQQFVESYDGTPNLERHQVTFNYFGPGFRYELGLFKNLSISSSFTPGLAFYEEGYAFGYVWHTRTRFYINFEKRYNKEKNISYNSADYLAVARSVFWEPLTFSHNLDDEGQFSLVFWGGVYGIQRTNEKGLNYNLEFGIGYYEGIGVEGGYGPLFNFTFGWVATNRKKKKVHKLN
ncbi:hypothetical protein [Flavobacterium sp. CS20]|jgi:hypothetical protein|uniref:hypothetical protein n=1 Tax=Flavobacterium sp. CS20 TaxID=2775246 RepID=UPI001B39DF95|nr:hypothetical protein [Flavobacterium sp. CS20]QTY26986.1 hypothetical protein IGB25_14245 [Flavobacterium sp. CS20]